MQAIVVRTEGDQVVLTAAGVEFTWPSDWFPGELRAGAAVPLVEMAVTTPNEARVALLSTLVQRLP